MAGGGRPGGDDLAQLLGEVGLGSVKAGYEAQQMVAWARKHGIQSTIHTGGPSIPGSGLIDKDVVLEADADIKNGKIHLKNVFRKTRPDVVIHMATVTHLVTHSEDRYRINLGCVDGVELPRDPGGRRRAGSGAGGRGVPQELGRTQRQQPVRQDQAGHAAEQPRRHAVGCVRSLEVRRRPPPAECVEHGRRRTVRHPLHQLPA